MMRCPSCERGFDTDQPIKLCLCGFNQHKYTADNKLSGVGPGTELERLIPDVFKKEDCCECKQFAAKMNCWGPDGCQKRFDAIVSRLVAKSRATIAAAVPGVLVKVAARRMLRKAIANARHAAWDGKGQGNWVSLVTTAPRGQPTIAPCINSIREAGWEPVVFAEPGSVKTNCKTIENETKRGCWHNWLHSLRWAIENTTADVILTIQDDAQFHPDSRAVAERAMWPDNAGVLSLYMSKAHGIRKDGSSRPPGIQRVSTGSFWGSLALAFPRHIVEAMLESRTAKSWNGMRPKSGNPAVYEKRKRNPHLVANSDYAMGRMLRKMNKEIYFVVPSPVRHIAPVSSIAGHGGNAGKRNCFPCSEHDQPLPSQVWPR